MDETAKSKITIHSAGYWLIDVRARTCSSNKALDILHLSLLFPCVAYLTVSLVIRMHLGVFILDI
jgi:hypothetical protein